VAVRPCGMHPMTFGTVGFEAQGHIWHLQRQICKVTLLHSHNELTRGQVGHLTRNAAAAACKQFCRPPVWTTQDTAMPSTRQILVQSAHICTCRQQTNQTRQLAKTCVTLVSSVAAATCRYRTHAATGWHIGMPLLLETRPVCKWRHWTISRHV
jgi:hypothetical protein